MTGLSEQLDRPDRESAATIGKLLMPPVFPVPTLDHVVVNARDRIDEAADTYRRLGFTLTPRGYHTLGSMNHLAMFGTDYLELIAVTPGDDSRPEIMAAPFGLNGLVFGTEDATATYEALRRNEVPIDPPRQFSRPVESVRGRAPGRRRIGAIDASAETATRCSVPPRCRAPVHRRDASISASTSPVTWSGATNGDIMPTARSASPAPSSPPKNRPCWAACSPVCSASRRFARPMTGAP